MHTPRKRFGQNFLIDDGIVHAIVNAIHPQAGENVVEIGPGLGALTRPLLERLPHLHAVELDRDIIARLHADYPPEKFGGHRLVVHEGDALAFDFATLPAPLRIVGNLPYNISSPLLFHFAAYAHKVTDMHFMLQDEVVERMVAEPSTAAYGRLSVMLQYRFHLEWLLDVPPASFDPPPKVQSALVEFEMAARFPEWSNEQESSFLDFAKFCFAQKRKSLVNNLARAFPRQRVNGVFTRLQLSPKVRAEQMTLEQLAALHSVLKSGPAR